MEKNLENLTSEQPDMFQSLDAYEPDYLAANAPDLDIEQEFMGGIKYGLRQAKKHGFSRDRIVDRMNLCLPNELRVTLRQVNGWCAESGEYRHFPAIYLPAFIWAIGGIVKPLEVLTQALGLHLIDGQEQLAAELGRSMLTKVEASRKERDIKQKLGL